MTLPTGIVTRTLTISTGSNLSGQKVSLQVYVAPAYLNNPTDKHVPVIVWNPTSQPVSTFFTTFRTAPDQSVVLQLPLVDQVGFVDENQNPVAPWTYKITVSYLFDGRTVNQRVTKFFSPTAATPAVSDFDSIPTGLAPLYQGPAGPAGKSAYQIALDHGFVGTEEQWLSSLSTGGVVSLSAEDVQDIAGAMGVGSTVVTATYDDASGTIVYTIAAGQIVDSMVSASAALSADKIVDGTENKVYTTPEQAKLSGIAPNATANDTDAHLRDRATHTGTQTASTISDLDSVIDAKVSAAETAVLGEVGQPNGIAALGGDGKLPATQFGDPNFYGAAKSADLDNVFTIANGAASGLATTNSNVDNLGERVTTLEGFSHVLKLGPNDPIPGGTPANTLIVRTLS